MNPMREIIENTELEAVCGGIFNFSPLSPVTQINAAEQVAAGVGIGGLLGVGIASNTLNQINANA
jgi:hypothetical protein